MTRKELSQLYHLNREIEQDKARLAELESAAISTTPKVTGLPHLNSISDKTAIAAEIADQKTLIESKAKMTIALYNKILRYVSTIEDSLLREVIMLRNVNCLSWRQVAYHVGGGNTEEGVRKIYCRGVPK